MPNAKRISVTAGDNEAMRMEAKSYQIKTVG